MMIKKIEVLELIDKLDSEESILQRNNMEFLSYQCYLYEGKTYRLIETKIKYGENKSDGTIRILLEEVKNGI